MAAEVLGPGAGLLDHRDQRNCARIYDVVERAWRPSTALDRVRNCPLGPATVVAVPDAGPRYFVWMQRLFTALAPDCRARMRSSSSATGAHTSAMPRATSTNDSSERSGAAADLWANNTTLRLTDPRARKVARHSPTYYWQLSRARYWINNQNFPPELAKPTGTRFLQTWHGTPLKKMQHDVGADGQPRRRTTRQRAARLTSYWDLLLSGSPYATACFRSAFRYSGQILEVGYSAQRRVLLAGRRPCVRRRARERLGLAG